MPFPLCQKNLVQIIVCFLAICNMVMKKPIPARSVDFIFKILLSVLKWETPENKEEKGVLPLSGPLFLLIGDVTIDYWFCFGGTPYEKMIGVLSGISCPRNSPWFIPPFTRRFARKQFYSRCGEGSEGLKLRGGSICLKLHGNDLGPCKLYLSNLSAPPSMKEAERRKICFLGLAVRFTNCIMGCIALPQKSLPIKHYY